MIHPYKTRFGLPVIIDSTHGGISFPWVGRILRSTGEMLVCSWTAGGRFNLDPDLSSDLDLTPVLTIDRNKISNYHMRSVADDIMAKIHTAQPLHDWEYEEGLRLMCLELDIPFVHEKES